MSPEYKVEINENEVKLEQPVSDKESLTKNLEHEGFERDSSGDLNYFYKEDIEVYIEDSKVEAFFAYEEKPDEWILEGVSKFLEGEKVSIDFNDFRQSEAYSRLAEEDYPYLLDRDARSYPAVNSSPKR